MQSKESLSPLSIVKNLGTDEMFTDTKANPDDELPEPNSKEGGTLCSDSGDCIGFMKWFAPLRTFLQILFRK